MKLSEEELQAIETLEFFEPDDLIECSIYLLRKVTFIAMKYINEVDYLNKYIEKMYKAYIDVLEKYSEVLEQQIAEFKED